MFNNRKLSEIKKIKISIEGKSVEKFLREKPSLEPEEIYSITSNLCDAIVNSNNINSNYKCLQLKPSNILFSENGTVSLIYSNILNGDKDFYSIGMFMYYMATGKVPSTILEPLIDDNYAENIDQNLIRVIRKCLESDIKNQYISIEELSKDLSIMILHKKINRMNELNLDTSLSYM